MKRQRSWRPAAQSAADTAANGRRRSGGGIVDPGTYSSIRARYLATAGVLSAGGSLPANAGNVATWQDQTGNGNHLVQGTDGRRPSYRTADGPNGGPCLRFEQEIMGCAALHASISNPTVVTIFKPRVTGSGGGADAADMYWSGDGTPTFNLQAVAAGTIQFNAATGSSGTMAFTQGEWGMHRMEAVAGAGEWAWNDIQPRLTTALGVCTLDAFYLGARYDYVIQAVFDVVEILIFEGALTSQQKSWLRTYAAATYGFAYSSERSLVDTFTRADTANNSLGLGETLHAWQNSSVDARIKDNKLSLVSPYATSYNYPQINFFPDWVEWDPNYRDDGGVILPVRAFLITKVRQSLNNMVHLVHGETEWHLEQFTAPGPVIYSVASRNYTTTPQLTGTYRVLFDWAAGLIHVTDLEGVTTICDWDATANEPLINFKKPYICFEAGVQTTPGAAARVAEFDAVRAGGGYT